VLGVVGKGSPSSLGGGERKGAAAPGSKRVSIVVLVNEVGESSSQAAISSKMLNHYL